MAFDKCVAQGATTVVVSPYFLSPGRHWAQDIPALTEAAAAKHPGVQYLVSAPIGLHRLVAQVCWLTCSPRVVVEFN
jgi:sirohydrochlorin ferrochelatase